MKDRIIFGATSNLAESVARLWARRGDRLTLVGRNANKLAVLAKDLQARGASQVEVAVMDFSDPQELWTQVEELFAEHERVDTLLVAQGDLGYGTELSPTAARATEIWNANFQSAAVILLAAKGHFVKNSWGSMAAFTAIEGRLGRAGSYFYGSAKAALETLLQGLREELSDKGINVCTIAPYHIDTALNREVPKDGTRWSKAEPLAQQVALRMETAAWVSVPPYLRLLYWAVGALPESLARRIKY